MTVIAFAAVVLCACVKEASGLWWGWQKAACRTVETVQDLDLEEYTRATWYVQKQQVNGYQREDQLFCVAATYSLEGQKVPFFKGTVVTVNNYANDNEVNGNPSPPFALCARAAGDVASKLVVAPCFLPNFFAGPYWVLAVGADAEGRYEWAIISGGQPREQFDDGCTTKRRGTNGSGFWYFTRERVASAATLAKMDAVAREKGFTLQFLLPVQQEGCKYEGALIKPNSKRH